MHAKRLAASLLLAVLVASCASTPATPAPAGSPPTTRNPSPTASPGPTEVTPSSSGPAPTDRPATSAIAIAAGSWHTCAVMNDGGVKCWGSSAGTLGDGSTIATGVPVGVPGLASGVKGIAAGEDHTCALTDDGGVKCWGYNEYGQLGDGSTDDSMTPVDVSGLRSGVTAIASGSSHVCALTVAGGVKCWGYNYGDSDDRVGTAIDSSIPVDVPGPLSDHVQGTVGGWCELTPGGGVQCSGDNWMGQLGDGTTTDSDVPVDVVGLASGVTAIAAGDDHV
jgi:alpha-tubulin suppressor-like RCC1 family protein